MSYVLMNVAKVQVQNWANRFFRDESGDTNFISILIVLGIVIVLVVFFQSQLETIINTVKSEVSNFKEFSISD